MAATGPTPLFTLDRVGRRYGSFQALQDVSLTVRPGERIGLIGPSGAGKSTLLALLNTAHLPTSGALRIFGEDPTQLSARNLRRLRARVGTVHQFLDLVPQSSVFQNVVAGRLGRLSTPGAFRALLSRHEAAKVGTLLGQLGLSDKLYERTDRLSGGEQQRVAIARVLHQSPDVLLADEPLASLDPARSVEIVQLLLSAAEGRALVVSTHQLEPILDRLTRVVALREGRVHFDKQVRALTAGDLASLYALSASAPRPETSMTLPAMTRLGATPLAVRTLLTEVLQGATDASARVQVTTAAAPVLLDAVRAGRLDAALLDARVAVPEVVYEELLGERGPEVMLYLAARRGSPALGQVLGWARAQRAPEA